MTDTKDTFFTSFLKEIHEEIYVDEGIYFAMKKTMDERTNDRKS